VVITVDDGHRSVYDTLLPLVRQYQIPVTLFIYPSAISNASYAMTWDQLRELTGTGLFTVQSHTYWHPNFKREKKRLSAAEYDKVVTAQLQRSKAVLEKRMGTPVTTLAWPFGIYDDDLLARAAAAGYVAAFSIDGRAAGSGDNMLALPRFLMTDAHRGKIFESMVATVPVNIRNSIARQ
jgi:peptidoglycan/xylan/chitin deacetylase (PgdA/CDA1 family)